MRNAANPFPARLGGDASVLLVADANGTRARNSGLCGGLFMMSASLRVSSSKGFGFIDQSPPFPARRTAPGGLAGPGGAGRGR